MSNEWFGALFFLSCYGEIINKNNKSAVCINLISCGHENQVFRIKVEQTCVSEVLSVFLQGKENFIVLFGQYWKSF